ncbi:MAG TPA: metallopeptidase TldD-related protein, partial [SAR324 cluster bacterium]|nr:metallopeptidase TldD-related protein [SAR324 cluster bacterium]
MKQTDLKMKESTFLDQMNGSVEASVSRVFEEQMGIDEKVLDRLLNRALDQGGDFADLFFEYSLRHSVVMEEGIIKNSAVAIISGLGVRVVEGDQTGYAYSEDLQFKAMLHAAGTASAIAHTGKVKLSEARQFNQKVVDNHYPVLKTISDLELTSKIGLVQQAEEAARQHDSRIIRVTVALVDALNLTQVVTSEGGILRDTRPMFRFNVHSIAQDGDQIQNGTAGVGGRVGLDFLESSNHPEELGTKSAKEAILLLGAKQAPSGPMPVLLGPAQSGILLHEAVGHPLEADFNRKGTSAYSGRIGEKVASELCTIYDAGTVNHDRGSLNFDDEGSLTRENVLIEQGILRGYMHDRISADYYNLETTGNGRRESYAHYPLPRMTTTYLAAGESDPEDIIRSVKKGVYCASFSGGQVDISNGDFVFVPTIAWLVEDGQFSHPIKNFTLIGNGPDAMS